MSNPLHSIFGLRDNGLPLVFLAPIAGYSNSPMRRISHRHGSAMSYTEMASARGLLEPGGKSWAYLESCKNEGPVVAHLYDADPDVFAEAAAKVEQTGRFVAIDLNAGCPTKKVIANGAGAELLKDPQRIHDILAATRKAVRLPITVKTRIGPVPDKFPVFDVLAAAEAAGAAALTLHARFTSQGHRGDVHLDILAEVKRRAKIPVIGNGDVHSPYAAWRMFEKTQVDAVMVARAAIGNPWVFQSIRASFASRIKPPYHPPTHVRPKMDLGLLESTLDAHLQLEYEHLQMLHEKYGIPSKAEEIEATLAVAFRSRFIRYLRGLKGACVVRRHLCELNTFGAIRQAVRACIASEAADRASQPKEA